MHVPAWQIATWSEVSIDLSEWDISLARFRHLGTTARQDDSETGLRHGQAFWAIDAAGAVVGVAWDWAEVLPGVAAMSDPMTILSNVVLVDDLGHELDSHKRLLRLNNLVFSLPWQRELEPLAA